MAEDAGGAADYLVVEDPEKPSTWHLRVRRDGKPDHGLMGAAYAALFSPGGHRGNRYEGPGREEAGKALRALYKSEGMDWPGGGDRLLMESRIRFGISLREGALGPTDKREVEVVCIRPGLSRNGNFYGPECLSEAVPLFEGARAYVDHSDATLRSVRDLAGSYKKVRVGQDGEVRATLRISKSQDWLWSLIQESVEEGTDLVGLSIDVQAKVAEGQVGGKRARIVEHITSLASVDVITRASAGGSFEKILEADKQSWWDQCEPLNEEAAMLARQAIAGGASIVAQQRPVPAGQINPVQLGPSIGQAIPGGEVQLGGTYVVQTGSAQVAGGGEGPSTVAPVAPPAQVVAASQVIREGEAGSAADDVARLLEQVRQERAVFASERLVETALGKSELPAAVKARLARRFAGQVVQEADLTAAIDEERAVLAELTAGGLIRGMGYEKHISVTMTEADRLQKAFDQLFDMQEGEKVPALSGIREAYTVATKDFAITGVSDPVRLQEANEVITSTFSYLLGTSMNKRLLKDYQAWPSEWQKFCTVTPIKDFKLQTRVRLGAFGALATVAEDGPYVNATLSDTQATYTPTKRGNLVSVSRETIINDDLYAIKQIPGKLAVAAAFTLAEFVYTMLAANGSAIYDSYKLFDITHHVNTGIATANLGTANQGTALASSAMQTAVTAMRRQLNAASKPIGLKPRFLIVPPELEWTAMVVTKSAGAPGGSYNDINPMLGYCEVMVAPQISSATYWALVADPRVIDTIEIGFVGGQMNPQLFIQDQPLFGNNFTNDMITYKVRHEYGGAVADYRGFYLGNN